MKDFNFTKIELIEKGMASDKKYYVEDSNQNSMLLRIADIAEYDQKKLEYSLIKNIATIGVPMSEPIGFGICDDGKSVYTLLSWIKGKEVESVLPTLSNLEQYDLGLQSGKILNQIHSIPVTQNTNNWAERYFSVINERLDAYRTEGVAFKGDSLILEYLKYNEKLLQNRPQCYHHGDYHSGNMILSKEGDLSIIDWHTVDFDNYGDPWYEFNRIDGKFPSFNSGQIDGYFDGNPPKEFWALLAYYLSASAITSIVWAKYFAPKELASILKLNTEILEWYDNMQNLIPKWYKTYWLNNV